MIPPLSSAHEWEGSRPDRQVPPLPDFGRHDEGGQYFDQGAPPYGRVKQEEGSHQDSLDGYFCRGMDTTGPASWDRVLRDMERGSLEGVGVMNYKAGVRERSGACWIEDASVSEDNASICEKGYSTPALRGGLCPGNGHHQSAAYAKAVIAGVLEGSSSLPTTR